MGAIKWLMCEKVLNRRVGVAVALEHDRFGLILVEEDFVLERAGVLGSHDLHRFFREALPLLDLAGMELDPRDAFDLVHDVANAASLVPPPAAW